MCNQACADCPFSVEKTPNGLGVGVYTVEALNYLDRVQKLIRDNPDGIYFNALNLGQAEATIQTGWEGNLLHPDTKLGSITLCFGKAKRPAESPVELISKWVSPLIMPPALHIGFVPEATALRADHSPHAEKATTVLDAILRNRLNVLKSEFTVSLASNHARNFSLGTRRNIEDRLDALLINLEDAIRKHGYELMNPYDEIEDPSEDPLIALPSMSLEFESSDGEPFFLHGLARIISSDLKTQGSDSPDTHHALTPWGVWVNHTTTNKPKRREFLTFDEAFEKLKRRVETA